jgi:hypothetical protein
MDAQMDTRDDVIFDRAPGEATRTFITPEADLDALRQPRKKDYRDRGMQVVPPPAEKKPYDFGSGSLRMIPTAKVMAPTSVAEEVHRKVIVGDPIEVERAREEIRKARTDMNHMSMEHNDLVAEYHDLVRRHQEEIQVLTSTLNSAIRLCRGDGEHPESLIEKMQENCAYLTSLILESETLHDEHQKTSTLLRSRTEELASLHTHIARQETKISDLISSLDKCTRALSDERSAREALEVYKQKAMQLGEKQDQVITGMRSKLANTEAAKFAVEHEREQLLIEKMQLENQRLFQSLSDDAGNTLTAIPPFVIFSIIGGRVDSGLTPLPPGTKLVPRESILPSGHAGSSVTFRKTVGASLSFITVNNSHHNRGVKKPLQPLRQLEPADDPSNPHYIPDGDLVKVTPLPVFDIPPDRAVLGSVAPAPGTDGSWSGMSPRSRRTVAGRDDRLLANLKTR